MEQEKPPVNTQTKNQTENTPSLSPDPAKSRNSLAVPCALAAILAVAGIAFGVYGMFFHHNLDCATNCQTTPSASQTSPSNTSQTAPTVSEVKDLLAQKYGILETTYLCCGGPAILYDGFDEEDRFKLILGEIMTDVFKREDNAIGNNTMTLDYDSLNTTYKKYFGNDNNLEKKDYPTIDILGVDSVSYVPDSNSFEVNYIIGVGCSSCDKEQIITVAEVDATEKGFDATVVVTTIDRDAAARYYEAEGSSESYYTTNTLRLSFVNEDGEYKLISAQDR